MKIKSIFWLLSLVAVGTIILSGCIMPGPSSQQGVLNKDGAGNQAGAQAAEPSAVQAQAGLDRTDADQVAMAFLDAYKQKDLDTLAGLANEINQPFFTEIQDKQEESENYQALFSGWRWEVVNEWDGTIDEVRYRHYVGTAANNYNAYAKFAELELPEIVTVTLSWEEGQWALEDIHTPNLDTFQEGRTEFSLEEAAY